MSLDGLEYAEYEVTFKFSHYEVSADSSKNALYFDVTGVEAGGYITFDAMEIYSRPI